MKRIALISVVLAASVCGCSTVAPVTRVTIDNERALTLGIVQRDIRRGLSAGEVASILGAPNIVSRDASQVETWIYDKISTQRSYADEHSNVGGVFGAGAIAGVVPILGGVAGSHESAGGISATAQKTLTVVIKFDTQSRVDTIDYHSSSF